MSSFRQHQHQPVPVEGLVVQLRRQGLAVPGDQKGRVDLPLHKLMDQLVIGVLVDAQVDIGIIQGQFRDQLGGAGGFKVVLGVIEADAEGFPLLNLRNPSEGQGPDLLAGGQHPPGHRQNGRPNGGEKDLAPVPDKELDAQLPLQLADLIAEPGLGDVQRLRRPAEVELLCHGDKILKLLEFHIVCTALKICCILILHFFITGSKLKNIQTTENVKRF